jgi:hypothetical protein
MTWEKEQSKQLMRPVPSPAPLSPFAAAAALPAGALAVNEQQQQQQQTVGQLKRASAAGFSIHSSQRGLSKVGSNILKALSIASSVETELPPASPARAIRKEKSSKFVR